MSYGRKINQGGYPVIGEKGENGGILYPKFYSIPAVDGQTVVTDLIPYQVGKNLVYMWKNSEFLIPETEFIEVNPTTLAFTSLVDPCIVGDRLNILIFYVNASYGTGGEPAGGVLSGTYPNPGFAVDMATQAELNQVVSDITTLLGNKANRTGNNATGVWPISIDGQAASIGSLAGIPQGGAATGQILSWNGAQWIPINAPTGGGGGGGDPVNPIGPAGGVLAGEYPNPGFAVEMATKADIDALQASLNQKLTSTRVCGSLTSVKAMSIGTSPTNIQWNATMEHTGGSSLTSGFSLVGAGGTIIQSINRPQGGFFILTATISVAGVTAGQLIRFSQYNNGSVAGLGTPIYLGAVGYAPTSGYTVTLTATRRFRNNPSINYGFSVQFFTVGGTASLLLPADHGACAQFTVEFVPD